MTRQYGTARKPPRAGWLLPIKRVEDHEHPGGRSSALWLCRCLCGRECRIFGQNLHTRRSVSCGCLRMYTHAAKTLLAGNNPDMTGLSSILVQRLAKCINDGREIDSMPFPAATVGWGGR